MVNMGVISTSPGRCVFSRIRGFRILKNDRLVELCISIAVRFAGELLGQESKHTTVGMCRSGEPTKNAAWRGAVWLRESINRAFARLDLEKGVYPFGEVFERELEEEGKDIATLFLSVDRSAAFQELIRHFAGSGADFSWMRLLSGDGGPGGGR